MEEKSRGNPSSPAPLTTSKRAMQRLSGNRLNLLFTALIAAAILPLKDKHLFGAGQNYGRKFGEKRNG